jgi:hypothetical protein
MQASGCDSEPLSGQNDGNVSRKRDFVAFTQHENQFSIEFEGFPCIVFNDQVNGNLLPWTHFRLVIQWPALVGWVAFARVRFDESDSHHQPVMGTSHLTLI